MFKSISTTYFNFTKKERTGIVTLLILILFFLILPFLYPLFIKSKPIDTATFKNEIATLKIQQQDSSHSYTPKNYDEENYQNYYQPSEKKYNNYVIKGELFYFDPNTASVADWQRLGIRDKTVGTIKNYLSKGGRFYKPEDIGKIWGLHPNEVERLIPYIQIAAKENNYNYPKPDYEIKKFDKPKYTPSIIDINNTDTTALIALPGIGSKLANRILNFRNKLGGFYKIEQIGETFGLSDSTFQKLKPRFSITNAQVKQININTASLDELKAHPYIRYAIANAIIQYKNQHGNFLSVSDLKKIIIIPADVFNKVAPYLTVQ